MASLPNNHESSLRTPPTGGQIPPCIADVFMESREVLLNVIMELRADNNRLREKLTRIDNIINDRLN